MADLLDPTTLAARWLPQRFGRASLARVPDPIVEPLWSGPRILAAITRDAAALFHEGTRIAAPAAVAQALCAALDADAVIAEGVLSAQALATGEGAFTAPDVPTPSPRRILSSLVLPGTRRRDRMIEEREAAIRERERRERELAEALAQQVAFIATDLLWIDGEELLEVPLLERKRLLESALRESELVRRTAYVRPTAGGSLVAWKALGFETLAYKAANGRYRPGEVNEGWATAATPDVVAGPGPKAGNPTSGT